MRKESPPGLDGEKVFSPKIIPRVGILERKAAVGSNKYRQRNPLNTPKRKRQSSPMGIGMLGCLLILRCVEWSAYFATSKALLWFFAGAGRLFCKGYCLSAA